MNQPTPEWEKEFDEKFDDLNYMLMPDGKHQNILVMTGVKEFIRNLLKEEKSKSYAEGQSDAMLYPIYTNTNEFKEINQRECEYRCEECYELNHCGNHKCGFTV